MKVVILAGGLGSRISEESHRIPKPMIEIGGKPILWHVLQTYYRYGFCEFIICLGYKGHKIKEYFANYAFHETDVTFDFAKNETIFHGEKIQPLKVTLVETGRDAMTGARLKRIEKYVTGEPFMLTYGDGVGDINLNELIRTHKETRKIATVTAVETPGRFGTLGIDPQNLVAEFNEKPANSGSWISAGYFVLEPEVFEYVYDRDDCTWEQGPMQQLSSESELSAYKHYGFWHPMDTLRDKRYLEDLCLQGSPPWLGS